MQNRVRSGGTIGILGGMGPLASADFVRTLYERAPAAREQDAPVVLLHSDPSIPDRTEAFLAGRDDEVLAPVTAALERLVEMGAERLVVCCMTAHHLLPRLPAALRARVVSVVDVAVEALARAPGPHLMVCTRGTRVLRIFEQHPGWAQVADRVVLADDAEQELLHRDFIYPSKGPHDPRRLAAVLAGSLERHGVRSFLVGCSEVHMLARPFLALPEGAGYGCVDPFLLVADRLVAGPPAAVAVPWIAAAHA